MSIKEKTSTQLREEMKVGDTRQMVDHPPHYTSHPSGIECIQITRHMGFNLGNVFKYIWRCDLKHDSVEDLEKAIFCLRDEIQLRRNKLPKTELGTATAVNSFSLEHIILTELGPYNLEMPEDILWSTRKCERKMMHAVFKQTVRGLIENCARFNCAK